MTAPIVDGFRLVVLPSDRTNRITVRSGDSVDVREIRTPNLKSAERSNFARGHALADLCQVADLSLKGNKTTKSRSSRTPNPFSRLSCFRGCGRSNHRSQY